MTEGVRRTGCITDPPFRRGKIGSKSKTENYHRRGKIRKFSNSTGTKYPQEKSTQSKDIRPEILRRDYGGAVSPLT